MVPLWLLTVSAYHFIWQPITASDSHVPCSRKQQVIEAITLQAVLMVPLWLLQVADQLPWHRKDPASLLAAGKWISAPELVHIIDTAWKHAELDLQQEGVTVQTSRQLHDAALASVTFSHLPPIRLSCIRGLVAPS